MSNILVTGGAGFIGSHVAESLVARGHGWREAMMLLCWTT
jgi:nucleoside-diphosphate-sugar epimerase